jgi:hypothetical protein
MQAGYDHGSKVHRALSRARSAASAELALERTIRAGVPAYDRARDLPALIRLDPFAPLSDTPEAAKAILSKLERALRAERNRARSGHWTYDLNRHIALRQAYVAEIRRLAGQA